MQTFKTYQADKLADSIGINTHFGWYDSSNYKNQSALVARLKESGIRYFRDSLINDTSIFRVWRDLYDTDGIRMMMIAGQDVSPVSEAVRQITTNYNPDHIWSIEGHNEPPLAVAAYDHIRALSGALEVRDGWAAKAILGPSFNTPQQVQQLGGRNLDGVIDYLNIHPYPSNGAPEFNGLDVTLKYAGVVAPSLRAVSTENGYHTKLSKTDGHLPVSGGTRAIYTPRLLVDAFMRGVKKTVLYELMRNDAPWAVGGYENRFGLIREDGSITSTFSAVKDLIRMTEDPGEDFEVEPLVVQCDNDQIRGVVLERRDGIYQFLYWNPVDFLKDDPSPIQVNITFARNVTFGGLPVPAGTPMRLTVGPEVRVAAITVDKEMPVEEPSDPLDDLSEIQKMTLNALEDVGMEGSVGWSHDGYLYNLTMQPDRRLDLL